MRKAMDPSEPLRGLPLKYARVLTAQTAHTGRDGRLHSGLRACSPTLQRQQTNDDLQTIHEPMLELLGQHVVALQECGLLTKPCLFPPASRLQFGRQRIMPRLRAHRALNRATQGKLEHDFLG
jgi:hypothetical protein